MINLPRGRNGPWIPKIALRSSPRASSGVPPSYLWRIVNLAASATAIAACAAPEYPIAPPQSWPIYANAPASGVFVVKAPNTNILIRGDVVTPAPPQSWPFYSAAVAQPNQSFHFLLNSVVPPRLEAEAYATAPVLSWPYKTAINQSFHFLLNSVASPRLEAEVIAPSPPVYWPWNRFAQPFQPLLIWANPPVRTVDAEALTPAPPGRWPYYVSTAAQPKQSFHFLFNSVVPPRLEAEVIAPSPPVYWPWNRFAQPFQPLLTWANPPVRTVDAEALAPMAPGRWPYYVSTAAQPKQSFHFLLNSVASPRLEAEVIAPSPPVYWPWNRATPFRQQSFSFLLNTNKTVIIDPEAPPPAGVNPRFPSWSIVVTYGNTGTGGSPIDSG